MIAHTPEQQVSVTGPQDRDWASQESRPSQSRAQVVNQLRSAWERVGPLPQSLNQDLEKFALAASVPPTMLALYFRTLTVAAGLDDVPKE